jgi:hypothetical protein
MKLIVKLALFVFVMLLFSSIALAAETLLLTLDNSEHEYELTSNETIFIKHVWQGTIIEGAEERVGDCTEDMKKTADEKVLSIQEEINSVSSDETLSEEEKSQKISELNQKINALIAVKKTVQCSLRLSDENQSIGVIDTNFSTSFKDSNLMAEVGLENILIVDKISEKDFNVMISGLMVKLLKTSIFKIKVPGKIVFLDEVFEDNNGVIEIPDVNAINTAVLSIVFSLKEEAEEIPSEETPPQEQESKDIGKAISENLVQDTQTILFQALNQLLPFIILGAIILIVLIIAIVKFLKKKKKSIKEKETEKKIVSAKKFIKKEEERKRIEEENIEKLVKVLKGKNKEYSAEEIKQAIINQGYSERVANEVIKRLFA